MSSNVNCSRGEPGKGYRPHTRVILQLASTAGLPGEKRLFRNMFVFQARPALSADLPRPLSCPNVFLPARRPVYPADATTQPHLLLRRAHGRLRRLVTKFQGAMSATGAFASSAASLNQGTGSCLRFTPAPGARALSAAPLSYGIIQATGVLCLGHHSSQHRHGSPRTKRRPPPATRRAVVRLLRLHVTPFSEGVLLLRLPPMRRRSV